MAYETIVIQMQMYRIFRIIAASIVWLGLESTI